MKLQFLALIKNPLKIITHERSFFFLKNWRCHAPATSQDSLANLSCRGLYPATLLESIASGRLTKIPAL
jgi:hypothetical protein